MKKDNNSTNEYKLVKVLPSNTNVIAWHIKINNVNYHIMWRPGLTLKGEVAAYEANNRGLVLDYGKKLFDIKYLTLEEGCLHLVNFLKEIQ